MHIGIKRHVLGNQTSEFYAILCSNCEVIHQFFSYVIASSTEHQTNLAPIHTLGVYLEAYSICTHILAITAEFLAKVNLLIQDFHNRGVFVFSQLQREADVLRLSPFVAQCGIKLDGFACIGLSVAIPSFCIIQSIGHQAE